jgi:hypothetical protein
LKDAGANLVDEVAYTDSWYRDASKEDGGWSLEQINPDLPCSSSNNWRASTGVDGGTPGSINSIHNNTPDTTSPALVGISVLNNVTLLAHFDEEVTNTGAFTIAPLVSVASATVSASDSKDVVISLGAALDTGTIYLASVSGTDDCSGNILTAGEASFILPHIPMAGDLIINEVLFNPFTGGSDFVEVYNNSPRYIDVYGFYLADFSSDTISNAKFVDENFVLRPGDYIVFTEDSSAVMGDYLNARPGRFVQTDLPTYSNESGDVYLLLPNDSVSDNFSYHEDMHFGLINDPNGISLERIDFGRTTNDAANWHSAAETEGFATPGYENSQYFPGTITEEMVSVDPEIFSPDNDGFEDVINIYYSMEKPGYVGNLTIYDAKGRLVKTLVENELLATNGTFTWDGVTENRLKARIGAYILYFEVFNTDGVVSSVKKPFVVAGSF